MARKPAYANRLIALRDAGRHPARVAVVYGNNWRGYDVPILAIRPEEYQPGLFDFRSVTGLPVEVVDQVGEWPEVDGSPVLFWLAAEVAEWACEVVVHSVAWPDGGVYGFAQMDSLAFGCKRGPEWPVWWSDKKMEEYGKRNRLHYAEKLAAVGRSFVG